MSFERSELGAAATIGRGVRAAPELRSGFGPTMVLAVLGVVIQAGTMNLQQIVVKQNSDSIFGWNGIGFPYVLTQFVGFLVFMIAVQAELTQTPFDMPIAESELVSGYMTEYSGFRFLIFFIAEFATAGVFSLVASTMFLGGWGLPWAWFSWHTLDDVHSAMNVIEGEVQAWIDGHLHPMKAGDLAAFPAGTGISHCFINNGDCDALLLVGGDVARASNRIFYPLNPSRRQDLPAALWWHDLPPQELGPHDGLPDVRRGLAP